MHYASPKHERLYRNVTRGRGYRSNTLAALYLLTAKRNLWKNWAKAVSNQGIEWTAGRGVDSGWEGYSLERAAQAMTMPCAQQITLRDLTSRVDYPQELLRLVITALWIARHDPKASQEILVRKGQKSTC